MMKSLKEEKEKGEESQAREHTWGDGGGGGEGEGGVQEDLLQAHAGHHRHAQEAGCGVPGEAQDEPDGSAGRDIHTHTELLGLLHGPRHHERGEGLRQAHAHPEPVLARHRVGPGYNRYSGDREWEDPRLLPARPTAYYPQVRAPDRRDPLRPHHARPLPHQGARYAEPSSDGGGWQGLADPVRLLLRRCAQVAAEVVVATPGRLKDLVNMGVLNLKGVSYLVLDEADRMLDQGFEDDIREIIKMCHPERQTALFSATWPEAIRQLAQEFLDDPVKVTIGSDDLSANMRIKQIVEVIDERDKPEKLIKVLKEYANAETKNRMIVFVCRKSDAAGVEEELWSKGYNVVSIHGDRTQWERSDALDKFRSGTASVLVATDVAARGLDIPDVEVVINFGFPLTIEDYVHRIGGTGRAGKDGIAHSFFTKQDYKNAGCLVKILKDADQEVPPEMLKFDLRIRGRTFEKFFNKDGNSQAPVQCFNCKDTGHMSRECPTAPSGGGGGFRGGGGGRGGGRGGGAGGGDGCFKCGEQGHFSRECPS